MKALVTGGAGFIGSHLVDSLLAAGHQVVVLDNLSSGEAAHLDPRARLVVDDLVERERSADELMRHERPDLVFHLAAQVSVGLSFTDPVGDARQNVIGSVTLLEAAATNGVKKVIYSSSAAVYGEPQYLPVDEDHPLRPMSAYGTSKHSAEHYLEVYRQLRGLRYTALRYANVYGPRQSPLGEGGAVAVFAHRMLCGETPVIYGSGEHERDYVFVGDVARANLAAIERGDGRVYNIGRGKGTTTNELWERLKALTEYRGQRVHGPPRPGDVLKNYLDPRRAAQELGWQAEVDLEEGLARTVEDFLVREARGALAER